MNIYFVHFGISNFAHSIFISISKQEMADIQVYIVAVFTYQQKELSKYRYVVDSRATQLFAGRLRDRWCFNFFYCYNSFDTFIKQT